MHEKDPDYVIPSHHQQKFILNEFIANSFQKIGERMNQFFINSEEISFSLYRVRVQTLINIIILEKKILRNQLKIRKMRSNKPIIQSLLRKRTSSTKKMIQKPFIQSFARKNPMTKTWLLKKKK